MHTSAFSDAASASHLIGAVVEKYADELIDLRRDLHAHPELSWAEHRTTELVATRIARGGLARPRSCRRPG